MELTAPEKERKEDYFGKRSGWLFLAKLFPTLTFLVITILYSRELSFTDYGIFQSVWMLTNVSVVIFGFGVYSVLLSSGYEPIIELVQKSKQKFFFFYGAFFLVVLAFVYYALQAQSIQLIFLVPGIILIHSAGFIFEALLIINKKEKWIFFCNLFYSVLFFIWHYFILSGVFHIEILLSGVIVLALVRLFLYVFLANPFIKRKYKKPVSPVSEQHWFFIGLNEVVGVVAKWLDKLLLVYFLTPSEFAIFFNGSIEIPVFGILISVVGSILLVEIAANLTQKEKVIKTFRETFLLLSTFVFPLFWFLLFFREEIFQVVFSNRYNASIEIFLFSILIIPVRITHYSSILQCYNKAAVILKGSVLDIVIAICLMPALYYWLGIKGIALAIVISSYIQSYYYLHHSARVLQTSVKKLVPILNLFIRFAAFFLSFYVLHIILKGKDDILTLVAAMLFTGLVVLGGLILNFKRSKNLS